MEREIKFRGKCVKTGKWLYGGTTAQSHTIDNKSFIVSNQFFEGDEENEHLAFFEVDTKTVGQFTGLKDKNGVEIYEGDFLNAYESIIKIQFSGRGYEGVYLNIEQALVETPIKNNNYMHWEVIGNVFENPEILNN